MGKVEMGSLAMEQFWTDSGQGVTAQAKHRTQTDHLAHDARNWLTVLQVYCDLLRTSGAVAPGYENWMDELSGAVQRGQRLMNSLLDSMILEDPGVPRRKSAALEETSGAAAFSAGPDLDLAAALSRRLPLLRRMAGDAIDVEIAAPVEAARVQLPESEFERILYNLVANAIEAMPQGGKLRIALCPGVRRASNPASTVGRKMGRKIGRKMSPKMGRKKRSSVSSWKTVSLSIADTGTGIAPHRLSRIFDAGTSGKRKWTEGPRHHGFGLAIVRELTERAGGSVHADSQPGRGSRFEVALPAL